MYRVKVSTMNNRTTKDVPDWEAVTALVKTLFDGIIEKGYKPTWVGKRGETIIAASFDNGKQTASLGIDKI